MPGGPMFTPMFAPRGEGEEVGGGASRPAATKGGGHGEGQAATNPAPKRPPRVWTKPARDNAQGGTGGTEAGKPRPSQRARTSRGRRRSTSSWRSSGGRSATSSWPFGGSAGSAEHTALAGGARPVRAAEAGGCQGRRGAAAAT